MRNEIIKYFLPLLESQSEQKILVDATVGFGGHTDALFSSRGSLRKTSQSILYEREPYNMLAHVIDADEYMLSTSKKRLEQYGDRISYHNQFFDQFFETVEENSVDMILMDLGVSSYHFKESKRGFSKHDDTSLDMRLSLDGDITAFDIINFEKAEVLTKILREYGEERQAYKWVNRIIEARKTHPIESARALCTVLQLGKKASDAPILARIFQAFRIAVNDELGRLQNALPYAWKSLKKDGVLAIISFHSLEDRIVKYFFRHLEGRLQQRDNIPIYNNDLCKTASILTKKPLVPNEQEIEENIASRSAKLRVAKKIV